MMGDNAQWIKASYWKTLDDQIQDLTFIIDRPPEIPVLATDGDDHLIQVPASSGRRSFALEAFRDRWAEFKGPTPDRS